MNTIQVLFLDPIFESDNAVAHLVEHLLVVLDLHALLELLANQLANITLDLEVVTILSQEVYVLIAPSVALANEGQLVVVDAIEGICNPELSCYLIAALSCDGTFWDIQLLAELVSSKSTTKGWVRLGEGIDKTVIPRALDGAYLEGKDLIVMTLEGHGHIVWPSIASALNRHLLLFHEVESETPKGLAVEREPLVHFLWCH